MYLSIIKLILGKCSYEMFLMGIKNSGERSCIIMEKEKVFAMSFAKIYSLLVAKAER